MVEYEKWMTEKPRSRLLILCGTLTILLVFAALGCLIGYAGSFQDKPFTGPDTRMLIYALYFFIAAVVIGVPTFARMYHEEENIIREVK